MTIEPSPKALADINQDFETRAAQARADEAGLPFVDLLHYPLNPDVLKLVSAADSAMAKAIPFHKNGKSIRLAVVDHQVVGVAEVTNRLTQSGYNSELWLCSQSGFDKVYQAYDSELVTRKTVEMRHDFEEDAGLSFEDQFKGFENLIKTLELVPVTQALNEIQIAAIQAKASDIHLQPYEDRGELRFRMDGLLHTVGDLSAEKAAKIVGQIKYEAGMKANITDVPQDGHISFVANDRKVDLRVSSLPTEFSESIVMRVLDSSRGIKSFTELGFDAHKEQQILGILKKKNGMVLVTGPTGSGKTTTLYAMLKELNTDDRKLVTLEDPIEYHLDNVTQSQVSSRGDYNFANGLKALLRHDPDVMLIGEIRELSTAKLAAEAALTGHVVLSSLHTNSAIGAITRLRNLGLESYNIASSLNGVFAQRLVRKVCPHCAQKKVIDLSQEARVSSALERAAKIDPSLTSHLTFVDSSKTDQMHQKKNQLEVLAAAPDGCEQCARTGFMGQTVIAEVFIIDNAIRTQIEKEVSEVELETFLRENVDQYLDLFEDGIRKALLGETTIEEVYRVAG